MFGREASQNQIIGVIEDLVGVQSARAIQAIIESAGQRPDSGFFATAIGMIFLLLGAGGVVGQLQNSLNTMWRVVPKTGRGIMGFLQDRLVYYSSLMFFFGAEFTQVYATRYGSKVTSAEKAQSPRPGKEGASGSYVSLSGNAKKGI